MSSFDYGGVDFGATILKERAQREMAEGGEISDSTLAALAANQVPPPSRQKRQAPAAPAKQKGKAGK